MHGLQCMRLVLFGISNGHPAIQNLICGLCIELVAQGHTEHIAAVVFKFRSLYVRIGWHEAGTTDFMGYKCKPLVDTHPVFANILPCHKLLVLHI